MAQTLFPDQVKFEDDILAAFNAGHERVCATAPTGFGKTTTFTDLCEKSRKLDHQIMIEIPNGEIADQICERFDEFSLDYGVIATGYKPNFDAPIQITTAISGKKFVDNNPNRFTFLITDECHRAVSKTSQDLAHALKAKGLEYNLGVTATPILMGGGGLQLAYDALVPGPSIPYLINEASPPRLVRSKIIGPKMRTFDLSALGRGENIEEQDKLLNQKASLQEVVQKFIPLGGHLQTIFFCPTVATCKQLAAALCAEGIAAQSIDGTMDRFTRRELVKLFRQRQVQVITSSELLLVGFDVPGIECIAWYRRTNSPRVWDQGNGRGKRWTPGKTYMLILDFVANYQNDNLENPDSAREYRLEGVKKQRHKTDQKQCPDCRLWVYKHERACTDCGYTWKVKANKKPRFRFNELDELVEITDGDWQAIDRHKMFKAACKGAKSYEEVLHQVRRFKYKDNYAEVYWEQILKGRQWWLNSRVSGNQKRR